MRREVRLDARFDLADVERALHAFRSTYNVLPSRALCAPGVLLRYCELASSAHRAHDRSAIVRFAGVPIAAAVLAPGTITFLGEVDEERMGDW